MFQQPNQQTAHRMLEQYLVPIQRPMELAKSRTVSIPNSLR